MRTVTLLLLACAACAAAPQDEAQQRADRLHDVWVGERWFGFIAQNRRVGYGVFETKSADGEIVLEDKYVLVAGAPEREMTVTTRCSKDGRLTPRRIEVKSRELEYTLAVQDGRASAKIDGREKEVEITPDTVTLHTLARLVCVLPRTAGFERKLKFLDLETLEVSDTRIACEGEMEMPGSKVKFVGVKYVVANRTPIELWTDKGMLCGMEGRGFGAAVLFETRAAASAGYNPDVLVCEANLRTLALLQRAWAAKFGGPDKSWCSETGKKFWLALAAGGTPIIPGKELRVLICPATGTKPAPGICSYRGPKTDVNFLGENAVIGCCESLNHADGMHVVTKAGVVRWVKSSTKEYRQLLEITRD